MRNATPSIKACNISRDRRRRLAKIRMNERVRLGDIKNTKTKFKINNQPQGIFVSFIQANMGKINPLNQGSIIKLGLIV